MTGEYDTNKINTTKKVHVAKNYQIVNEPLAVTPTSIKTKGNI